MLAPWAAKVAEEGRVEMNVIVPDFLFLGSVKAAVDVERLRERGVTDVLTVTDTLPLRTRDAFGADHHLHINVVDLPGETLSRHFTQAIAFIESVREANGKVLVHCTAGVSRSASVVMAYLMHAHRLTFKEAFVHVKLRRTGVRPNSGFLEQLDAFEKELHGTSSITRLELQNITAIYRTEWRKLALVNGAPAPLPGIPPAPGTRVQEEEEDAHEREQQQAAM